ncbi:MAG: AAA family ATPase [Armatimonadetes bacterium]|nr:AAA family ATPase [Armatimonadota bacterium]
MTDRNVPFAALIQPDNPSSGAYAGTSFVVFPQANAPALAGLVVGTDGLGADSEILGRPGHARKCHAIARWLNADHGQMVAWAKPDPTQQTDTVPSLVAESAAFLPHQEALARYGNVMYLLYAPTDDRTRAARAVAAILDLLMEERGIATLQAAREDATALRRHWLEHILPSVEDLDIRAALDAHRYVVLQGPPGTGKTRMALSIARTCYEGRSSVVQFHANTTYESFVGGLAPVIASGTGALAFAPRAGTLLRAIARCNEDPDSDYLLVIDEINRADLAKVLGEAIFLLEPTPEVPRTLELEYSYAETGGSQVTLPANLRILGTMNTADRSIAMVDLAIRRRFAFVNMWPRPDVLDAQACPLGAEAFSLLLRVFIEEAPADAFSLMPGHSYFLGRSDAEVKPKLRNGVVPLLREYLSQGFVAGFASQVRSYLDWVGDVAK